MKTYMSATIYADNQLKKCNITINGGKIVEMTTTGEPVGALSGVLFTPGLKDVHVHFREPGYPEKETVRTGSLAAAASGYTDVCTMPNLNPPPDCLPNLMVQTDIIQRDSVINITPYGTITKDRRGNGELSDMAELAPFVAGFSDDGTGVRDENVMRAAMLAAKAAGKPIVAHCEDESLLHGGYIHDGRYAHEHNHAGICSQSEWGQIERDLLLAKETGCQYHVCHISTKESVELIRRAKADGVQVTCETAPHYLLLCEDDLREEGRFKMNPPLRSREDRQALIDGVLDGTIDVIATDHAPHTAEQKSGGLRESCMGIVGLETAFPLMYTEFVKTGRLKAERLLEMMCTVPAKIFGIGNNGDFSVFDLDRKYVIDSDKFISKGHSTPFDGHTVYGKCVMTVCNSRAVYEEAEQ